MPRTVKEITQDMSRRLVRCEGGWPSEFDTFFNSLSQELIRAFYAEHGEAWLGRVNRYSEDKGKPYLVKYEGQNVYNFEYGFIIPCYDEKLVEMIKEREHAPYTGSKDDIVRIEAIHKRIVELKGELLIWV